MLYETPASAMALYYALQMHGHDMSHMAHSAQRGPHDGFLGETPMSQEGSGTSWLPARSAHHALMLPMTESWSQHLMGTVFAGFVHAGGKRGESQWFSNSMLMYMAKREDPGGTWGFHAMVSLDPLANGNRGVPNLFQTGETLDGQPLVDRQHPHDLIAELAIVGSRPLARSVRGFAYLAPVGEPALGGPMFLHRPSGFENPEAPITHHWFDSTHISFGVATLGATFSDRWKVEASAFNGHEPDENRYAFDPVALNSAAGRVTYNPDPGTSLSLSYGFLDSPESLEPGVSQHRWTASALFDRPAGKGDIAAGLLFGEVLKNGARSAAWNFEATYSQGPWSVFSRLESVQKDELAGVPAGDYRIGKVVMGAVKNVAVRDGLEYGVGAYVGAYAFPSSLEPFYGKNPFTIGAFLRVRPSRM